MPRFSTKSMTQLASCVRDIQTIFMEVVKFMDISIIEGNRTAERQHHHWCKGRELRREGLNPEERDAWVIKDSNKVVTHKDGYQQKSRHQQQPSVAIDVVPYPTMWADKNKLIELRGVVKFVQTKLLADGKIETTLDNGGDLWNGFDLPHYQLKDI